MIDKKAYATKLQEVLAEKFPSLSDVQKMSQLIVEPKVYKEMSEYVIDRYGSYYSDKITALMKENQRLLKECLSEMGITK